MTSKILAGLMLAAMIGCFPSETRAALSDEALTLKGLYEQLQQFKNDSEFHKVGYACCRFKAWLKQISSLNETSGRKLLRELGFVPDDLRVLGREYMRSNGKPTPVIRTMEQTISNGFSK